MDLCIGSMLDYLQDIILKDAKLDMSRAMFETAFGLAYLHEQKIIHGCLTLCKVMLWTENDNPNSNPIVKITGYIQLIDNDKVFKRLWSIYNLLVYFFPAGSKSQMCFQRCAFRMTLIHLEKFFMLWLPKIY